MTKAINPSAPSVANDRILRALRCEPVDRIPVWVMRQAGRYLPEYRATRAGVGFLEMCRTPDLAATVTLQPIDIFGFDAAILFSDILVLPEALGLVVEFDEGHGPKIANPVRRREDVEALVVDGAASRLAFVGDAIRECNRRLAGRVPLLGFAGAPWTIATYAVEGGGTKTFRNSAGWLHADRDGFRRLLDRVADATIEYLLMQAEAGVHAVQLFESWGGQLSREDFDDVALPPIRRIVDAVSRACPVILYLNGSPQHLESMGRAGATAIGVDWRLPLREARRRSGAAVVQGNLDPTSLYAPEEILRGKVRRVLEEGGSRGHVFNLGHGILPDAPVDSVRILVDEVRKFQPVD